MRLATFTHRGRTRVGVVIDDFIVDLSQAAPELPSDMTSFLEAGAPAMELARSCARAGAPSLSLAEVRLEAPVLRPRKFLGIGANYPRTDAERMAGGQQIWFNKQVSCVNGPFDPILLPRASAQVIHEVELAVVIGRRCRRVSKEDATTFIAGYLICNDVTVVDWLLRSPTATLGKSFDTHGPIGPWIVTADEVGDPSSLGLRASINGELRQQGNTTNMRFDCREMIAYLSELITLEPGDILTTGTPEPVVEFLRPGDVVRCEIDGIGHIENAAIPED